MQNIQQENVAVIIFSVCSELLLGAQEDCALTVEESSNYPHCNGKMAVSFPHICLLSDYDKNVAVATNQRNYCLAY